MWIAKNSITGKTYGDKFKSIYDCQKFIDKELIVLQYEFKKVFALEEDILYHIECDKKHKSIADIFKDALNSFENSECMTDIRNIIQMTVQGKKQKEVDDEINRLALVRWSRNNIIRCWNVEQKRFADGFDF